jgi:hypothetical protein
VVHHNHEASFEQVKQAVSYRFSSVKLIALYDPSPRMWIGVEALMEFIRKRIRDTALLSVIEKFLVAGHVDAGVFVSSDN